VAKSVKWLRIGQFPGCAAIFLFVTTFRTHQDSCLMCAGPPFFYQQARTRKFIAETSTAPQVCMVVGV
jgi:hypothetical protein